MERIYGIREGSAGKRSLEPKNSALTQNSLADKFGISVDTLQNYKLLTNMIPELEELVGLIVRELERIYGIHQGNGSNQYKRKPNNSAIAKSQEDLAIQMGISVDTLQNYKLLTNMIPELEELVGLIVRELERIYGIREGSAGKKSLESNNFTPKEKPQTEQELATTMGITRQTLQNLLA